MFNQFHVIGYTECGGCGETWQIEVVQASGVYKSVDDWVSACRNVEMAGVRCKGEQEDLERMCEG